MSKSASERIPGAARSTAASCLSLVVVGLSLIPAGLFLFSLFGRYFFYAELLNNFRLHLVLLMLPFPMLLWAVGNWRWGLTVGLLTAWCAGSIMLVYVSPLQPPPGPEQIKIMSFNVYDRNNNVSGTLAEINRVDPDVLAISEYAMHWPEALAQLENRYPHRIQVPRWHGFGAAIFSRFPLTDPLVQQLSEEETDIPLVTAVVDTGKTRLRLYLIHVLSPTNAIRLKYRNEQFVEIAERIGRPDEATILVGDFNCVPWSPFLKDLMSTTGLRDSRQGFGYHGSWHTSFWLFSVPIDNAFVSGQVHVHDRELGEKTGSDHLPMVVTVSVSE